MSGSIFRKKKKSGGSVYSVASSRRQRPVAREEIIGKKINDLLREKERNIYEAVRNAMYENLPIDKDEISHKIDELDRERVKIIRK